MTATADAPLLLQETRGPLALLTLNRPDKRNALSLALLAEIEAAITRAEQDEQVRAIAITGAGDKAFAAGADLGELAERDLRQALEPMVQGVADRLMRSPKPTIAAINGICFGGGLEIALGCDLRVACHGARFATPEGRLGIIPGGGATQRLPRLVGPGWALELLLMGETVDAERALQIGLITRLVAPDALLDEVQRMAERLAEYAPLVPRFMKAMVHNGLDASLSSALALEKFAQSALCETDDKAEGIQAFLDKRPPRFSGR